MKRVVLVATLLGVACRVKQVDLGSNEPATETPPPFDAGLSPVDAHAPTLEEQLNALCMQPIGLADRYGSAFELTHHAAGRWYLCGDPARSPLLQPAGVELREDGTWVILELNAARTALEASTDPDERGTFDYYAFSDADAGAGADGGGGPRIVAIQDPTARGGLFVYLHRGVSDDFVVSLEFESVPRRMFVRDVGPSGLGAYYVTAP